MAGAMAGSAVFSARQRVDRLRILTLTINNICNLRCPHCYLQYNGTNSLLDTGAIDHILHSSFSHLCIVGKEPLANRASADSSSAIVDSVVKSKRSASLITNGLNLGLLNSETLSALAWLDLSMDAGPLNYQEYRGGNYSRLVKNINYARQHGLADLRILNTVSSANISWLQSMIDASLDLNCDTIVVSPFQTTKAARQQTVSMVEPRELLDELVLSGAASNARVKLAWDVGYLRHFNQGNANKDAQDLFGDRFMCIDSDPIDRGFLRITYDGLVLSPFEAIDTEHYAQCGRPLKLNSVDEWFKIVHGEAQRLSHQWH